MSRTALSRGNGFTFARSTKAIVALLTAALSVAVISAPQASANSIATLKATSTIKGVRPSNIGPDYTALSQVGTQANGAVTLSSVQAADTSNAGSYITSFIPTDAGATATKVVFYPSGTTVTAPQTSFGTDTAYNGTASLTGGGFFVIEITASDTVTKNYYQIAVAVLPATADATLKSTSTIKGQLVSNLGSPNADITLVDSDPMLPRGAVTLSSTQASDTSTATSFVTNDSLAVITKVVKFAQGATVSSASFAAATAYASQAITDQDFFIVQVTASDTTTVLYYKFAVTVTAPVVLSSDATLTTFSSIKGQQISNLGTPNATLASAVAGAVTLSATQGADTSNAGSYVTSFTPTDPGATVAKTVKYASGASTSGFATDAVYNGAAAIMNGDFFIIEVTAANSSVLYYKIVVTVSVLLSSDASLRTSSTIKGQAVTNLGTPSATLSSVVAGTLTLTATQSSDTSNAGSYITSFVPTDAGATVTRIVKYSNGASTAGFATDSVYNGTAAVLNGDFFEVAVTAANSTVLDYKISVTVSAALVTVPNLAGLSTSAAQSAIANAGFTIGTVTLVDNAGGATAGNFGYTTGTQSPAAGSSASAGSAVSFSYYSYTAPTPTMYTLRYFLPFTEGRLVGLAFQKVSAGGSGVTVTAIANSGWAFTGWSDGNRNASRVDTAVNGDMTVEAKFSPVVPNLSGLSVAAAEKVITDAGFAVGQKTPVTNKDGATSANNLTVTGAQFPTAGSVVNDPGAIDFSYYSYTAYKNPGPTVISLYVASPLDPNIKNSVSVLGGGLINLVGSNFVIGAKVSVGGASATDITWMSSTMLAFHVPAGQAGAKDVTVTNPDGQSATGTALITYVPRSLMTTKSDASQMANKLDISVAVGSKITIPIMSPDGTFVAGTNIQARSDSGHATVPTTAPVSSSTLIATVEISGVSAGKAVVTLSKEGYADAVVNVTVTPAVPDLKGLNRFDAEQSIIAAGYTVGAETVVPNHPAIGMGGTAAPGSEPGHFTGTQSPAAGSPLELGSAVNLSYYAFTSPAPSVSAFDVKVGTPAGGTQIHVSGHGLDIREMFFGDSQVTQVHGVDDKNYYIGSPSGTPGAVDVKVVNQDGQMWTGKAYFTYAVPTVPNLFGLTKSAAEKVITDAGFTVGTETSLDNSSGATVKNDGLTTGTQSPNAGNTPGEGSKVDFSYYTYLAPAAPTVQGVDHAPDTKEFTITGTGFVNGAIVKIGAMTVSYISSSGSTFLVASLSRTDLGYIPSNPQDVTVTNSDGQVGIGKGIFTWGTGSPVVPNLKGLTVREAEAAIKNAGFTVGTETPAASGFKTMEDNQKATGAQTPSAGSAADPNSQIDFSYFSIKHTISFWSTVGEATPQGEHDYSQSSDKPVPFTLNRFVRPGYTFAGWNASAHGGGTSFADGSLWDITLPIAELYAQWTPIQYEVSFDANGAKGDAPTGIYGNLDKGVALPGAGTMTKSGFVFAGWSTTGTAPAASSTSFTTDANVTLLAIWTIAPKSTTTKKSAKTKSVPNIIGLPKAGAELAITNGGFKVGTESSIGNADGATVLNNGQVSTQTPSASTKAASGSAVDLVYYTYTAPAVSITSINYFASVSLDIKGTGFVTGATVTIGGYAIPTVVFRNSGNIIAAVNSGTKKNIPTGAQDVTVTNPDGTSATTVGAFTWGTKVPLPTVPNLSGLTKAAAEAAITAAGFKIGTETSVGNSGGATALNDGKATGSQSPAAGTSATAGSAVDFSYYVYVAAPTISSVSYSNAKYVIAGSNFLNGATIKIGGKSIDDLVFRIDSTDKMSFNFMANGLSLIPSTPQDVTVTNLDGLSGIGVGLFTWGTGPAGPSVPYLSGLTKAAAEAAITKAGFMVGKETLVDISGGATTANSGTVTATQNPKALTTAPAGSTVDFSYYKGPAPVVTSISATPLGVYSIYGSGFASGATVKIAGVATYKMLGFVSHIDLDLSSGLAQIPTGAQDVVVTNPDGQSGTGVGLFTWGTKPTLKKVPDLSGLAKADAEAAITKAGFNIGTRTSVDNAGGATAANNGTVTSTQNPAASTSAAEGSKIDFSYYAYTAPSLVITSVATVGTTSYIVNGSGFVDGATITIAGNIHPTILQVQYYAISFKLTADQLSKIRTGGQDLTVINPDGSSTTGLGVFRWGTLRDSFILPTKLFIYGRKVPLTA